MKILITGASGFLGRNLVDFLESKGHETIKVYGRNKIEKGVQLDLLDFEKVERLLEETKPDFVVHAAACCNVAEVNKAQSSIIFLISNPLTLWTSPFTATFRDSCKGP